MYRCTRVLTPALVFCPLLAADARAELLLEVEGVELHGTAQLLVSGASTCNVLKSDTRHEARQANHGAPMDVWRLDFSMHNRTGKWLDHVIARYQIDAVWPACTNWGRPEGLDVFVDVDWAGCDRPHPGDRPERRGAGRAAHGDKAPHRAARRPVATVCELVG